MTWNFILTTSEWIRQVPSAGCSGDTNVQAWHFLDFCASILQGRQWKWMQMNADQQPWRAAWEALIQQCVHHWFLILEGGPWAPIRNGVRRREGIWQLGFAKELASEAGWFDLHFSSPQHLTVWVILVCTQWSALSQIGSSFSSLVSALSPNFGAVGGRESRFWNWTSPFLGFYGSLLQCCRQLRYLLPSRA